MPTILTSSQQTFVDITDQRKLSAYITSNLPKTQSEDPNVLPHTYAPSWATTNLVLTPVVFLDQTSIPLGSTGLTIQWKRKDGTAAETALTTGESVSGGILTVNQNKLAASTSGMITYICYISYYDSETHNTVNISADLTYTLVRNAENAKLAYITSDTYVFKYDSDSALVGATQATLTGQVQGVTITKWQYKNGSGNWADYPTTADNASITGGTLVVKPTRRSSWSLPMPMSTIRSLSPSCMTAHRVNPAHRARQAPAVCLSSFPTRRRQFHVPPAEQLLLLRR